MKNYSQIRKSCRFRWSIILLMFTMSSTISFAQEAEKLTKEQKKSQTSLRYAQKSLKEDKFTQAEAEYREAIGLDPKNLPAKYNLGTAYYDKNKNDEAMLRFKQAAQDAKTKEEKHSAFHNLGNTFMNAKKYQEAVESYKNALRNDPTDDETRYNFALAKKMLENNPPPEDQNQDQDQNDDQDDEQDQNQDQNQNQNEENRDTEQGDTDEGEGDDSEDENEGEDQQEDNNQDQQPQSGQLSPQQIKSLLEAMENEERKVQEKMNAEKQKGSKIESDKYW